MGLIIGILSLAIPYDEIPSCCPASRQQSQQPMAVVMTGVPPGLEYLAAVSSIYIKQDLNLMERKEAVMLIQIVSNIRAL